MLENKNVKMDKIQESCCKPCICNMQVKCTQRAASSTSCEDITIHCDRDNVTTKQCTGGNIGWSCGPTTAGCTIVRETCEDMQRTTNTLHTGCFVNCAPCQSIEIKRCC